MAIIFAFFLTVIIAGAGAAIDMSMAASTKSNAQATLDGAVLASVVSGSNQSNSPSDASLDGINYFNTYFNPPATSTSIGSIDVMFDPATGSAVGNSTVLYQTSVLSIFGFNEMSLSVQSEAIGGNGGKPLDIGLMLDVSGSMEGPKLTGLQDSVETFLDILIGEGNESENVSVALAPFSTSVNAGAYAPALIGGPSLEGCVGENHRNADYSDDEPDGEMFDVNGEFGISNDENSGVYRQGYFNSYPSSPGLDEFDSTTICSSSEIFPLSGNYDELINALNGFEATGLTGGHIGIAFAWYLVSENWRDFWPSGSQPGRQTERDKIVILMTDGQFNTYFQTSAGLPNDQGAELCDNMKADNVTIYSISFDTDGDSEDLLRECASTSSYFFEPDSTQELSNAFKDIANGLKQKTVRLSN